MVLKAIPVPAWANSPTVATALVPSGHRDAGQSAGQARGEEVRHMEHDLNAELVLEGEDGDGSGGGTGGDSDQEVDID